MLEDIGPGPDELVLEFRYPHELGYEEEKVGTDACAALIAQLVGIAELQNQLVGAGADILQHMVDGAPGALPHGQALVQGLLPHLLAGIVVISGSQMR